MTNIPEQLSAARKSQLEAQLNFFTSFTSKAVANAEKIAALNLNLARDTAAKSTTALYQALSAREPADLLALSSRAPDTFSTLIAYSRELMAIAAGSVTGAGMPPSPAAPAASSPKAVPFKVGDPAQDAIDQIVEQAAEAATAPVAPVAEPDVPSASLFEAEAAPAVTAKPMAKAVGAMGASNGALKSAAAPVPGAEHQVKVSGIKPVDASPPPAPATGTPEAVQHEPAAAKGKRKK